MEFLFRAWGDWCRDTGERLLLHEGQQERLEQSLRRTTKFNWFMNHVEANGADENGKGDPHIFCRH